MSIHNTETCPVCNGTGRMTTPDNLRKYGEKNGWYGYRKEDDCVDCRNCGAQYMFAKPTGKVRPRPDGTACVHEYVGHNAGRCLTDFVCKHCGDKYQVDSSD